jgi:Restriction endonuclease XhoI
MENLSERVREAVRHFWLARRRQGKRQGAARGQKDAGERSSVTGGTQLNGLIHLVRDLLVEAGLPTSTVYCAEKKTRKKAKTKEECKEGRVIIPGWFRPYKCWDLLIVADEQLLGVLECKSHIGPSFGNNYNNRTEEALGNATDFWAAYREGAFKPSQRPWLGFLMLLEEATKSTRPVKVDEPHFKVFDEFRGASYAKRYEILLTKLVRERLYDAACLLLSTRDRGPRGEYREPSPELSFETFAS